MTRADVLGMQVGRELDSLVAEKVMGLKIYSRIGHNYLGKDGFYKIIREYSTDISAAWEVVEKLINDAGIDISIIFDISREYKVKITDDGVIKSKIQCKTAPEAICKAALLAVLEVQ